MSKVVGISMPGGAPAAGFELPFEMLEACHERVYRMLALLGKLRTHLAQHGLDDQARQAARDIMRYFDQAAPQHHRDEELHVFPALVALLDDEVSQVVARLQQDHLQMEATWPAVRSLLEEVAQGARTQFNDADDRILDAYAAIYAAHIETEEGEAYPRARAAMDTARLQTMSDDMMARRGLKQGSH